MPDLTPRPVPRALFLEAERRPRVYFYTSNLEKSLQARLVCERFGLRVQFFRTRTDPYDEDYSGSSEDLLARAVEEIRQTVAASQVFFVEDTTIRIEAVSSPDRDVPGLEAKEWFAATSFEELDRQLRSAGNDRRATVSSDIALHIPGLRRPVFLRGQTRGRVADTPPSFAASVQYPWLTPDTFNGWFVPEGCDRRLGEMSLEESWRHDFRVRSLAAMLDRLEEYYAALNLAPTAYSVRKPRPRRDQPPLFGRPNRVLAVIGRTCAGKSTMGDYLSQRHGLQSVEVSGIVRMLARERGEEAEDLFDFARSLIDEAGPTVIAEQVVRLYGGEFPEGVVLSGFRTVEELEYLAREVPDFVVVNVDADERIRYERFLRRATRRDLSSIEAFRRIDDEQLQFGLLRVAQELADATIVNEGSFSTYFEAIDRIFRPSGIADDLDQTSDDSSLGTVPPAPVRRVGRLARTLGVLARADRPLTAQEVAAACRRTGEGELSADSVNEVLRAAPEMAAVVEHRPPRTYVATGAGRAFVAYLDARKATIADGAPGASEGEVDGPAPWIW